MSKIIGLDLSMCESGITVLNNGRAESFLVKSKKPKDNTPTNELIRVLKIVKDIKEFIVGKEVSLVLIEGLAFCARNTSALVQLSALNYMIREVCFTHEIPFIMVAPTSAKKFATGRGNAKKDEIMLEVYKRWKVSFSNDNLCDSYVLSKIGEALLDEKIKITSAQQEVANLLKTQLNN
jgi:crossover junction endodeoxyribonuclease RuvC